MRLKNEIDQLSDLSESVISIGEAERIIDGLSYVDGPEEKSLA